MSAVSCGCDPEANWTCVQHALPIEPVKTAKAHFADTMNTLLKEDSVEPLKVQVYNPQTTQVTTPFAIKDSGARQTFAGGMQRDVTKGKTDYLLVRDGPMLERWAIHLTNGAKKYDKRNWMKGAGQEELDRAKESAARHFEQYLRGDTDEDHASAVFFNLNQIEYLKGKL